MTVVLLGSHGAIARVVDYSSCIVDITRRFLSDNSTASASVGTNESMDNAEWSDAGELARNVPRGPEEVEDKTIPYRWNQTCNASAKHLGEGYKLPRQSVGVPKHRDGHPERLRQLQVGVRLS